METTNSVRDDLISDIAKVIAGLQVPVSLTNRPLVIFGAAYESWSRIKDRLTGFGWMTSDEVEAKLREVLA